MTSNTMKLFNACQPAFGIVVLALAMINPAVGQSLKGRVETPHDSTLYDLDCVVVICRDNSVLSRTTVNDDGTFSLNQPSDDSPYNLLLISPDYSTIAIRGLVSIEDTLNIQLRSVPRYSHSPPFALEQSIRAVKASLRSLDEARDMLPPGDELQATLTALEKRMLSQETVNLLVPAYFYPDSSPTAKSIEWQRFFALAKELRGAAELVVILNINSGSGKKEPVTGVEKGFDEHYAALAQKLDKAGIKWVGYIAGRYGKQRTLTLEEDFQFWIENYPSMSGVFLDELPDDAASSGRFVAFCKQVRKRYSSQGREPLLIANPGKPCAKEYATSGGFDWLCLSENPFGNGAFRRPEWADEVKARFGSISYRLQNVDELAEVFNRIVSERGEFLYFTDQDGESEPLWTRMPNNQVLLDLAGRVAEWNELIRKHDGVFPPFLRKVPR